MFLSPENNSLKYRCFSNTESFRDLIHSKKVIPSKMTHKTQTQNATLSDMSLVFQSCANTLISCILDSNRLWKISRPYLMYTLNMKLSNTLSKVLINRFPILHLLLLIAQCISQTTKCIVAKYEIIANVGRILSIVLPFSISISCKYSFCCSISKYSYTFCSEKANLNGKN